MRLKSEDWLQAQYSVLGSALIDESVVPLVVTDTCETDYSGRCRKVFRAMLQLFSSNYVVDPVSVRDVLGPESLPFLSELMANTPSAANVEHYIRICKEQAAVIAVREIAEQLTQVETGEEARQLVEKASTLMTKRQRRKRVSMSEAMADFMQRMTQPAQFLSWPIPVFNEYIRARAGNYIIIGAEPSVGKTAFALQCAMHWSQAKRVGFFSFETDNETLSDRLVSTEGGLDMTRIMDHKLSQSEWDKVAEVSGRMASKSLDLVPAAGYTTADIRAETVSAGYDLIIIDYLQMISARGPNRYEAVTNISLELHLMAQSMGVIVVALSQLSRSDGDQDPKISDLRESGQLEQDADVILLMALEKKSQLEGPRKVIIGKNKQGRCVKTFLAFDGKHQTFSKAVSQEAKHGTKAMAAVRKAEKNGGISAKELSDIYYGELAAASRDAGRSKGNEAEQSARDYEQMGLLPPCTSIPEQWKDDN